MTAGQDDMGKRDFLAKTLEYTGLGPLVTATVRNWNGLLVFNYHRIGDGTGSPFDKGVWSCAVDEFDRQVAFLKKNFEIVNVVDLDDLFHHPDDRGVMITFDDGYRDNYELAFPVLQRHGAPATFFITSGFLDDRRLAWWDEIAWIVHQSRRSSLSGLPGVDAPLVIDAPPSRERAISVLLEQFKRMPSGETEAFLNQLANEAGTGRCPTDVAGTQWMTWDMVRELEAAGMDIGGHTVTHPILSNADPSDQRREIFESKRRIEEELGKSIQAFSYPVGGPQSFTLETRSLLHEAGYHWAFSFFGGACLGTVPDRYALPRVAVSPQVSPALFRSTARFPGLFA